MITHFLPIFFILSSVKALHFNGGTITWAAVDPHSNSSTVVVTITQTYSWSFPNIKCDINVPITSSGRSGENDNLTCVVDCSTDGGYSTKPINILTDCTFASASMGMLTSQKSKNVTLAAGAHFSLAYQGAAWRSLGSPAKSGLDWSILSAIDLRKRPDGFINTPPVASVASPQYVIVNQTTQIKIPVSDVNTGDDVRCRWGIFRQGYRRKRQSEQIGELMHGENIWLKDSHDGEWNGGTGLHVRRKRNFKECDDPDCATECKKECRCNCTVCLNTSGCTALDKECPTFPSCTRKSTVSTASPTTNAASDSSTSETPGTKKSTSSFPVRQAIDECGGICFPSSTPNGTTLSNCTLSFKGLIPGAWYAVSIQVEDFTNSTSTEPMSSVPVQFLIYVQPTPKCPVPPVMIVAANCLELQVGHPINFRIYAMNQCNSTISRVADIVVTRHIPGIQASNLTQTSNFSFAFVTYSWTPQLNQIGSQIFCVMGVTSERVQSADYCVTFKIESYPGCTTTTTTTSSSSSTSTKTTTSSSSSSTSTTTATTATTSTSTSSTSTTSTSTTSSTSSSTTSSSTTTTTASSTTTSSTTTSTSSSTTSSSTTTTTATSTTTSSTTTSTSTSTTTSSTTTSTSTSTTSSSTTSTSTSTSTSTTTSRTTSTSTTTSTTSITTTSRTTTTSVTTKSTTPTVSNKKEKHWLFFLGLALLCLLLIICCACCLTYCFFFGGGRRRTKRRDRNHYKDRGTVDLSFRDSIYRDRKSNFSGLVFNEWHTGSAESPKSLLSKGESFRKSDVTGREKANVVLPGINEKRNASTKAKYPRRSEEHITGLKNTGGTGTLVSFQETIENIDSDNAAGNDDVNSPRQTQNGSRITRVSLPLTDQRSTELLSQMNTSTMSLSSTTFPLSTRSSLDSNKSMARSSMVSLKPNKSPYDHIKVTKVYKR